MIWLVLLFIYFLAVEGQTKTVTFRAFYPQQTLQNSTIFIRGNSCNLTSEKGYPMKKNMNDEWMTALLCPQNVTVKVRLYIDDKIGMSGSQQYRIGEKQIFIYPSFYPSENKIVNSEPLYSEILKNSRKLSIYYPPSYFQNPYKEYQILLMQDGQNLFSVEDSEYGKIWNIKPTLDSLMTSGKIQQLIVIGIWNTKQRCDEYTNTFDPEQECGGKADLYLDFIEKEMLKWVQREYLDGRTLNVYHIGGGSYGGLLSCYGIFTRHEKYKKGICMSSSFWWDSQNFVNQILPNEQIHKDIKVYMDSGEDNKEQTKNVFNYLLQMGYQEKEEIEYYYDKGGYHDVTVLGKRFGVPLMWLFGKESWEWRGKKELRE